MNDESQLWRLFTRNLAGEATVEEIGELEELLKQRPDLSFTVDTIAAWWKLPPARDKITQMIEGRSVIS